MKTYTTGQIIDILKLGQKAEMVANKGCIIYKSDRGEIRHASGTFMQLDSAIMAQGWQLLPQHVTFEEALKAYKQGKRVRVEWSDAQGDNWNVYAMKDSFPEVSWVEITEGKWSIVEDEN